MTVHTAYSVVTSPVNEEDRLKAYLYAHTALVATVNVGDRYAAHLLRTDSDELSRASYLSTYQCGRLQSGSFGVRVQGASKTFACNELKHWIAEWAG